ncbi:VOC family protein [Kangiella shandongensis]|uniref:VOC family protein n=1 Tax=Kangiella shandongensis TaxID=2763258 RepID=UPI001CBEBD39|nr:VOC family protein [Kangiella shandongensis]
MNQIYFEIQASEPKRAIQFYNAVFGWHFDKVEGLPLNYWKINAKSNSGGLLQRPADKPPMECGTNAFVCSFEVKNFDGVAQVIEKQGGTVALPKFAIPQTCWQGYFIDTKGNTFGIFQPDDSAGNVKG